jgi:hypothetical protein
MRAADGHTYTILGSNSQIEARNGRGGRHLVARLMLWPLAFLIAAEGRRRERDALAALDERLLRDIGVTRTEVSWMHMERPRPMCGSWDI